MLWSKLYQSIESNSNGEMKYYTKTIGHIIDSNCSKKDLSKDIDEFYSIIKKKTSHHKKIFLASLFLIKNSNLNPYLVDSPVTINHILEMLLCSHNYIRIKETLSGFEKNCGINLADHPKFFNVSGKNLLKTNTVHYFVDWIYSCPSKKFFKIINIMLEKKIFYLSFNILVKAIDGNKDISLKNEQIATYLQLMYRKLNVPLPLFRQIIYCRKHMYNGNYPTKLAGFFTEDMDDKKQRMWVDRCRRKVSQLKEVDLELKMLNNLKKVIVSSHEKGTKFNPVIDRSVRYLDNKYPDDFFDNTDFADRFDEFIRFGIKHIDTLSETTSKKKKKLIENTIKYFNLPIEVPW